MDKIYYFLSSYPEEMMQKYSFTINGQEQDKSFKIKKGTDLIFINKIHLQKISNEQIVIQIKYKEKTNKYRMKLKLKKEEEQKSNIFLFNYELELIPKKEIFFINLKTLLFLSNEQKYININLSNNEKFLYFFSYFFNKESNLCYELIQAFLREIGSQKIPIDIGISILVIYQELNKLGSYLSIINRINKNAENGIIDEKIFLNGIKNCLAKLSTIKTIKINDKNKILEIIVIYFIKYNKKDISILLSEDYKNLFLDLFKGELSFLDEEYLDYEISHKIIQNTPAIQDIILVLKKSKDYISYLTKIKDNIDPIYKAIESLKSLKGIFQADFEVSQGDNIDEFVKIHKELLEIQKEKKKYFIGFIPIIKRYFTLFNENKNLVGLCELLTMLIIEEKNFPPIKNIKQLKTEIITKIRQLLESKIGSKDINGKNFVTILSKLREIFNDGNIFNKEFKLKIFKYFIKKCKEKESEIIELYRNNKIYELFITQNNKIDICMILESENFDYKDNFMALLPDKLNKNELDKIFNLIEKISKQNHKDENENDCFEEINYIHYTQLFNKTKDYLHFLEKIKLKKENYLIIMTFIIGLINKNDNKLHKDIVDYLDKKFFKQDIFFLQTTNINNNENNNEKSIPIFVFEKLNDKLIKENFKKLLLNKLASYVIDEKTVFNEKKNNKFLLLEELYTKIDENGNNFFAYDYKDKTLSFIKEVIEKREECSYENIMKVFNNYKKKYYNKVEGLINEDQRSDLYIFTNVGVESVTAIKKFIKIFQDIYECLNKLFPNTAKDDINDIYNSIIKLKESKKKDIKIDKLNNIKNKYHEHCLLSGTYYQYYTSFLFMSFYSKGEKKEDEEFLRKTKEKFDCFIRDIFEKDLLKLNLDDDDFLLEWLQREEELRNELANFYGIYYNCQGNIEIVYERNKKVQQIIDKMKIYKEYKVKSKIIKGIFLLLKNLDKNENDPFYSKLKALNDLDEKIKFLNEAEIFLNEHKVINDKNPMIEFINSLSKYPKALEWLKNTDERNIESIYRYIIDSDYNDFIVLTNIIDIKNFFFKELINETSSNIIGIIFNLNKDLSKNIIYFSQIYPHLESINININKEPINFEETLNELKESTFTIQFDNKKKCL